MENRAGWELDTIVRILFYDYKEQSPLQSKYIFFLFNLSTGPQYSILRGKLLGLLHRSVQTRLGGDRIHTGYKVINCGSNSEGGAWAEFSVRGEASSETVEMVAAGLIVGCDGIHSNVRKTLTKEEDPSWIGITMLRGLTRMKPFLGGRTMTIIGPIENEMV